MTPAFRASGKEAPGRPPLVARLRPYLLIALALLPICLLRDFTPDNELRYLSIADEALRDGHFFTFYNHGVQYADKPPLYLWIVMLGKLLLGTHSILFLALFSLIPALLICRVMDYWLTPFLNPQQRLSSLLVTATCGLFLGVAVFVRMDMLMTLFIVLALATFYEMYSLAAAPEGEGSVPSARLHKKAWLLGFYVFMALFSKGPVGFLLPLLASLVFLVVEKQCRRIGLFWGWRTWIPLLAGCLFWFGGAWIEGGNTYMSNLLVHQTVDRAVNAFHHKEPFYYYLYILPAILTPWVFYIVGAVGGGAFCRKSRSAASPEEARLALFFVTVILTGLVMLSAFSSKLAIYLLPLLPFCAALAALWGRHFEQKRWLRLCAALPALLFALAALAYALLYLGGAGAAVGLPAWVFHWLPLCAVLLLGLCAVYSLVCLHFPKGLHKGIHALTVGLLATLCVGGFFLPRINPHLGCADLCHRAVQLAREAPTAGFATYRMSRSESMDVFLHAQVRKLGAEELQAGQAAGHLLILPNRRLQDPAIQALLPGRPSYRIGQHTLIDLRGE